MMMLLEFAGQVSGKKRTLVQKIDLKGKILQGLFSEKF